MAEPSESTVPISVAVPEFGHVAQIAAGLLWLRLPVPMSVKHINVYLVEDNQGWAIFDAGFGDEASFACWEKLLAGPLHGFSFTRLFVTHAHIDHIGAAAWLCRRLDIPLVMNALEYLTGRLDLVDSGGASDPYYADFLRSLGLDDIQIEGAVAHLRRFPIGVEMPPTYHSVDDGQILRIGGRDFRVYFGPGHSTAQLTLYCPQEKWYLAADHVLENVPPLLIQSTLEPFGDCYGKYLASLAILRTEIAVDAIVLPGHHMPFRGLDVAITTLQAYHSQRTGRLLDLCAECPRTVAELAPVFFAGPMSGRKIHYAVYEILAYANRMQREEKLIWLPPGKDGVRRLAAK